MDRSIHQGRGLRFPCNNRTEEINKLIIKWLFHCGLETTINQNQKLVTSMSCTPVVSSFCDTCGETGLKRMAEMEPKSLLKACC